MEKNGNTVPNIEKAILIMELLADKKEGLTLQDLVDKTGLAKTSVFRILNTFTNKGYMYKVVDNCFRLTKKFLHLGLAALGDESLIEKSLGLMRQLKDEIDETVLLGTFVNDHIVMLEQVLGNNPFIFYLKPGRKIMLHASAPGKAYLAFCDSHEKEALVNKMEMKQFNNNTITDKTQLLNELKSIKELGYAIDRAEELEGVHCLGAPIFSSNGTPVALLWTTGPSVRLPKDKFEENGLLIRSYAMKISNKLGYKI